MIRLRRCLLALAAAASLALAPRAMAATPIPFVGCIEQGPTPDDGSWTAPSGKPLVTSLSPAIAGRLAVYASNWSAVLAPRGWACRSVVTAQQGVAMIVSPPPPDGAPADGASAAGEDSAILSGPAIILWNDQSPAIVAAYTARYFPGAIGAITADERYCGAGCDALLHPRQGAPARALRFPSDVIRHETPFILAYSTPAGHRGLGNQIGAPAPGQPSLADSGLLALSNLPRGEGGIVNLTVRLPADLQDLNGAIIAAFRACLPNNNTLACESGHAFTSQGRPIDDGD